MARGRIECLRRLFHTPDASDINSWYADHPIDTVPILLDDTAQLRDRLGAKNYPTLILVDENMTIDVWDHALSLWGDRRDSLGRSTHRATGVALCVISNSRL